MVRRIPYLCLVLVLSSPLHAYGGINVSEVTDKEYLLSIIAERDRLYQQRFDAQQRALETALTALNLRMESINEFRNQLRDQERGFLTIKQYDAQHEGLENKIKSNAERIDVLSQRQYQEIGSREGQSRFWAFVVAAVGILAGLSVVAVNLINSRKKPV